MIWQFGDNYDQNAGLKLTHTKQRRAKKKTTKQQIPKAITSLLLMPAEMARIWMRLVFEALRYIIWVTPGYRSAIS
jgi:hypothetical protein